MAAVSVIIALLAVLFWTVVGLLAIVGAILCFPIRLAGAGHSIDLRGESADDLMIDLSRLSWHAHVDALLGLVRFDAEGHADTAKIKFKIFGFTLHPGTAKGAKAQKERGKPQASSAKAHKAHGTDDKKHDVDHRKDARRSERARPRGRPFGLAEMVKLLPEIRRLVVKMWRQVRPTVHGDLIYGFFDPALTGISQATIAVLPIGKKLRLTPDFTEGRLSGWIAMRVTIHPVRILFLLFATALRPAVRSWWWALLKQKFGRNLSVKRKKEAVSA